MSAQPKALRLADRLDLWGDQGDLLEAAAELRRLWAENEAIKAERDEDRRREYGYSQQVVDALTKERDALKAQRDALLEACRTIVQAFDALPSGDSARMARLQINAARAAITKAEEA